MHGWINQDCRRGCAEVLGDRMGESRRIERLLAEKQNLEGCTISHDFHI
jgi:hypothetical protein